MANRFAVGDTLGYQVYNQYLNQEIARKRAEEERRKQEEQRSKAKKHNAFGQLVNTAGSVIGAGVGLAASGGNPAAGLAGYQMGSAGSNLLMNLFPNAGGTEPDSSNPYYDKPSNMQVANQALGVGLQAYGQYNQYLGEQAKTNLTDFTKSLITDPNRSKAMTVEEISDAIKQSKEYEDAKGIFGESVLSDNTVRQIAQNAYEGVGQQAIKMFDMIQKAPVNENTQPMVDKWFSRYGDAYSNLMPEGMRENLTTSVTEKISDKDKADIYKRVELEAKTLEMGGKFDPAVIADLKKVDSALGSTIENYFTAIKGSYDRKTDLASKSATLDRAEANLKLSMDVLSKMDENTPEPIVRMATSIAASAAPTVTGMSPEKSKDLLDTYYEAITADPKDDEDFEKATQKAADDVHSFLMNQGPYDQGLDREEAIAKLIEQFADRDADGKVISLGPVGDKVLRMLVGNEEEMQAALTRNHSAALQSANTKINSKAKQMWDFFSSAYGRYMPEWMGGDRDVSEDQLRSNRNQGRGNEEGMGYTDTLEKLGLRSDVGP